MTVEEKRAYNLKYRADHPEKQRAYDARRDYSNKKPSPRDPVKRSALEALRRAIKRGAIVRPSACSRCNGAGTIQGHHEDYGQPLIVIWLCRACHSAHHRKYGRY